MTDENVLVAVAVLPFLLKSCLQNFIHFIPVDMKSFIFVFFAHRARCGIVLFFFFFFFF